jgi:hypothetical protein
MSGQEPISRGRARRFADQIARLNAGAGTEMVSTKEKTVYDLYFSPVGLLSPRCGAALLGLNTPQLCLNWIE